MLEQATVRRIHGVRIKPLKVVPDERGWLMEILRADDEGLFSKFGQAYVSATYPGVVKAWHFHERQTDNFACVAGMIKLVLFDRRTGSPTEGVINEFFLGVHHPQLVQVPRLVHHGWKCISVEPSLVLNIPDEPYDHRAPDEHRIEPHGALPYDWSRKDG
jgi:dTDP-4-dehydrorhamnose 3,5-epimerase